MKQRLPARRKAWRIGILSLLVLLSILGAVGYRLCFPGIIFLRTFRNPEVKAKPFVVTYLAIPAKERQILAKLYRPNDGFDRAILLVHGVHYLGYEEPRLTRLARDLARRGILVLMPETRSLVKLFLAWKPDEISKLLCPVMKNISCHPALSPAKNPVPACPLFLLHGSVDNVIPASETLALHRWAENSTPCRAIVSKLLRHVELENQPKERPGLKDTYKLIRFMTELLRQ